MTPRLILVFFTAGALLCAQVAAPDPGKKAVIEGKVLRLSGEPLPKATVHLRSVTAAPSGPFTASAPTGYVVTSDSNGSFLFDNIDPGRYVLSAERTGYLQQWFGARGPNRPGLSLTAGADAPLKDLVIMLTPQGIISGKVADEDGEPLAFAGVSVYRMGYQGGQKQLVRAGSAVSAADGSFLAGFLAPGRYYVSASDNRATINGGVAERPGNKAEQSGHLTTYYPNVLDPATAVPIDIGAGTNMSGVEIRLIRGRLLRIRGRLTGSLPLPGSVVLAPSTQGLPQPAPVQSDGTFLFQNVSPGEYTIRSNRGGPRNPGQPPLSFVYARVNIRDQDVEGLEIPLGVGRELAGTVRLESEQAAGIANVRVALQMVGGAYDSFGLQNAVARPDGSFAMRGLGPEKYRVSVNGLPQGVYVKSVRFENVDITHDYLDLTSGSGGALDILLSPKAADVSGVVRNEKGEPVPNVPVTLWVPGRPPNGVYDVPRTASTDGSGAFQIFNMAPGEYRVAAWEDVEPGLAQNPDFRARFESTAAKVEVQESAHATADTRLVGRDAIQAEIDKLP